jgi:hypothetical protein
MIRQRVLFFPELQHDRLQTREDQLAESWKQFPEREKRKVSIFGGDGKGFVSLVPM